ncbi:MAG: DUF1573 domain-containing protein [Prevotella sp.]|nr:DUF1573 domain-containing protein [Prevotella sp.]
MKKIYIIAMMLMLTCTVAMAQKQAQIKFDKTSHNFGSFPESNPKVSCTFTFTNVGDAPLVLNQVMASCGCTTPTYTKTPIAPGEKGEVKVVYDGKGKYPGPFKKTVTVRTNGVPEATRLYIEGDMVEGK